MADAIIDKQVEFVAAEQEHQKKISENYKKLLDSASSIMEEHVEERPAYTPAPAQTPTADNAARIRDYNAYRVPAGQRTLFDNVPTTSEQLVMSVPTAAATMPAATMPAAEAVCEEDALPTRRTMEMLNRSAVREEQGVGFFAALSTRLKIALCAVTAAVLVLIAIVCINTSVLRSMDARINVENASLEQLREQAKQIAQRVEDASDPDTIAKWAEENGGIK